MPFPVPPPELPRGRRVLRRLASLAGFLALLWLGFALRCLKPGDGFISPALDGANIRFVDGDCYARMTRVRQVLETGTLVIRHHDFENFPIGTTPHTTAPLDWLIALLTLLLRPVYGAEALDLAGAWIGPILAAVTMAIVWIAFCAWPGRWAAVAVIGVSPILVHGTVLARPDHQALLIPLLALALAAEIRSATAPSLRWGVAAGFAWGMALWVSLYEPLILLALVATVQLRRGPGRWWSRKRVPGWITMGFILLVALGLEGWRVSLPWAEPAGAAQFARWSHAIGELASLPPWSPTLLLWGTPLLIAIGPLLLRSGWKGQRTARIWCWLLPATIALTCWQVRWGYFFALATALAIPLVWPRKRLWQWAAAFAVCLSIGYVWRRSIDENSSARRVVISPAQLAAREILAATWTREQGRHGILAPWWLSAEIAYRTRLPGVAGSSHQSIPGAIDVEKFFRARSDAEAFTILQRRRVAFVVALDESELEQSRVDPAPLPPDALVRELGSNRAARSVPAFLRLEPRDAELLTRSFTANRVYSVDPAYLSP